MSLDAPNWHDSKPLRHFSPEAVEKRVQAFLEKQERRTTTTVKRRKTTTDENIYHRRTRRQR